MRVEQVADEARTRPPGERAAYLDRVCGHDPALRDAVQRLVDPPSIPAEPVVDSTDDTSAPTAVEGEVTPTGVPPALQIATYKVVNVLGEGGMGVVYQAVQDNPHRAVALKVLKAGKVSAQALRRFEHEADVLGRLQHPGIAQIFEAGTADTNYGRRPFFAMELVDGVPLKKYVEDNRLEVRRRLLLLVQICEAVQHAHQKGVIHRDLKPSNILVDKSGQPKILDFGIAMIADTDVRAGAGDAKQLAGTVPYMSLEQARGDLRELDTRTDVYALGVIAYQLLAGRLPFDLEKKTVGEAARILSDERPTPLGVFDKALRGDIEAMVDKALDRDKQKRYQSASDLAADFRRYLADQPVLARPPTLTYHLGKFAKRNKALVAGAALIVLIFVSAFIWTERARETARKEAARAQRRYKTLVDILSSATPEIAQGKPDAFIEILDRTADEIRAGSLADEPRVEAGTRRALGEAYRTLGLLDKAVDQLRATLAINQRLFGRQSRPALDALDELAITLKNFGQLEEAEQLFREALDGRRRILGDSDEQTLETMHNLAVLLQSRGRAEEAEVLLEQTLADQRRVLGEYHGATLKSVNSLALVLKSLGRSREAESLYRRTLEEQLEKYGDHHPNTLRFKNNLVSLVLEEHRWHEAEVLFREILEADRHILGEDHPTTLSTMNNLAETLREQGYAGNDPKNVEDAEMLHREVLARRQRVLGEDHPDTLTSMNNLATALQGQRKLDEAEGVYRRAYALLQQKLGDQHPHTIHALCNIALVLAKKVDPRAQDEAETILREVLRRRRAVFAEGHPAIVEVLARLGKSLVEKGDAASAEPLLRECLATRRQQLPEGDWLIANTESLLGECLTQLGRFTEAEPLLLESYPLIKAKSPWPEHGERAIRRIITFYEASGKPDKAMEYRSLLPAETEAPPPSAPSSAPAPGRHGD